MPWLNTCCGFPLKTGTIITGILGIIIGAATLLVVFLTNVKLKTIVIDTLPPEIVKAILAINLFMTIFISCLLIAGAIKRNRWFMLPWVILALMLAIGLAVSIIYTAVMFFINNEVFSGVLWILGLSTIVVYVYLWAVVFSFYQLVQEEKGRTPYGRPPWA